MIFIDKTKNQRRFNETVRRFLEKKSSTIKKKKICEVKLIRTVTIVDFIKLILFNFVLKNCDKNKENKEACDRKF